MKRKLCIMYRISVFFISVILSGCASTSGSNETTYSADESTLSRQENSASSESKDTSSDSGVDSEPNQASIQHPLPVKYPKALGRSHQWGELYEDFAFKHTGEHPTDAEKNIVYKIQTSSSGYVVRYPKNEMISIVDQHFKGFGFESGVFVMEIAVFDRSNGLTNDIYYFTGEAEGYPTDSFSTIVNYLNEHCGSPEDIPDTQLKEEKKWSLDNASIILSLFDDGAIYMNICRDDYPEQNDTPYAIEVLNQVNAATEETITGTTSEGSVPKEETNDVSDYPVLNAYTIATTITKNDMNQLSAGRWAYDGVEFVSEDCDWLNDPLNKDGTINQGAFYRKQAHLLQGYAIGATHYNEISERIIGYIPDTKEAWDKIYPELMSFITIDNSFIAIMERLQNASSVTGTIDLTNQVFDIRIDDVDMCADELGVSQEMFGWILADLEEYGVSAEFSENQYSMSFANSSNVMQLQSRRTREQGLDKPVS